MNNPNLTAFTINHDFAVSSTRERDVAMKTNLVKPLANRHAFTLVELIVVLTILVGLAGVLNSSRH